MTPFLVAAAGALLMWAAFPPLDLGLLIFVAPAPVLWALRRVETSTAAAAIGLLHGLIFFGALLWWMRTVGVVAWLPLTVVLSVLFSLYAILVWAFRMWPPARWWLVTVAGWGLFEFIRARYPLGGFPWGAPGFAAADNSGFIGAVQWIGPAGWGLIAVAVAAGAVLVFEDTENWRLLVDPLVVALVLVLAGSLFPPGADGPELRVAIVQGNSPCPGTHCPDEKKLIYESHLELTRQLPAETFDLVVWPENAMGTPFEPSGNTEVRADLETEARRLGAYLLVGSTRVVEGGEEFDNVNTFFGPNGSRLGEYAKRHPVPFGEFVPMRQLFGFIPQLDQVPRDMVRGGDPVVFATERGIIGSVISFEGAFPRYARSEALLGGQVLVVATNEGSFGRGAASDQLISMARVNAAAVGHDLVHAAITGKSALVTAEGDTLGETELFETTVLTGTVNYRVGDITVFTRYGEWLLIVAMTAAALALVLPGGRRQEKVPGVPVRPRERIGQL